MAELQADCEVFPPGLTEFLFKRSIRVESNGQGHFQIDRQSGDIRTTELFNQDTQLYYTLKVGARDGGSPPREEQAVVYVQVRTGSL